MQLNLGQLAVGDSATVKTVEGDSAYAHKLAMLGFTPGALLSVVRVAPMGDPIQIKLRGYNLSLRRNEARIVLLESPSEQ